MATITIDSNNIKVEEQEMPQQNLLFDVNNPRVYSALRENGNDNPTQQEIEAKMRSLEHVKELKQQIEQNGGIIEPLIVINRNDEYVVIEGNSRLAAYRILAEGNPSKWGRVRVNILPEDTSEDDIDTLLGTYHLTPKKDWSKYERAAYIYRMKQRDNAPDSTIAKKTGLSSGTVKKYLKIYEFMQKSNDTVQSHWNSYEQFAANKDFDDYRHTYPEIDEVVSEQIKNGKIKQAKDIRDKLAKIAKADGKAPNKIMKAYINKEVDIYEAYTRFEATGKSGNNYNKLKEFRTLIYSDEFKLALESESVENANISYELRKIEQGVKRILKKIK